MFGIGGFELFLILIFAFIIFGPDKLPAIAKTAGKAIAKFRNAQDEMKESLNASGFIDKDSDQPIKNPLDVLEKASNDVKAKTAEAQAKVSAATDKVAEAAPVIAAEKSASFAERKAAYDRERAARKRAQAEAAKAAESAGAAADAASPTSEKAGE